MKKNEKEPFFREEPRDLRSDLAKELQELEERTVGKTEPIPTQSDKAVLQEVRGALGLVFGLGITMIVCMGIGFFLGRYLDKRFGTSPACMLVFSFLGGAAAIKVMYDTVKKQWEGND